MGSYPGQGLPPIRVVSLAGRGTTAVREWPGPPGAPTVVLVHGVTLTADLNWFGVLPVLGRIAIESHRRVNALESANERFASIAASIPGVLYQRI